MSRVDLVADDGGTNLVFPFLGVAQLLLLPALLSELVESVTAAKCIKTNAVELKPATKFKVY